MNVQSCIEFQDIIVDEVINKWRMDSVRLFAHFQTRCNVG